MQRWYNNKAVTSEQLLQPLTDCCTLQEEHGSLHDPLLHADHLESADTEPFLSPSVTNQTEPDTEPELGAIDTTTAAIALGGTISSSSNNNSSSNVANSTGGVLVVDTKGGLTWQECLQRAEFWCLLLVFL
jgi:hypothetical protein